MLATPFLKDAAQAKNEWMSTLAQVQTAPIDVAYRTTYEIRQEYYPYAEYDMTCVGSWSATSVWEHEEQYQEPREETVYIDYNGKEWKDSGSDYNVRIRDYIPRQPMSRTVYETKTRTVIDHMERTFGDVGPWRFSEQVALSDLPSLAWANSFPEDSFLEVDDAYLSNFWRYSATVSDEDAADNAEKLAISDMIHHAKGEVPGDRFEEFNLDTFGINSSTRSDRFLSVYQIIYQYEGETYNAYLTGGTSSGDHLLLRTPVDESIKEQSEKLDDHVSKNSLFSRKTLFFIAGLLFTMFAGVQFVYFRDITHPAILALYFVGALYFFAKFAVMQSTYKKVKNEQERFHGDNTFLRQQIAELALNDSISDDEKQRMISEWLEGHSGGMAAGKDQIDRVAERKKRLSRFVNIVGAVLAGVLLVIWLLTTYVFPSEQDEYQDIDSYSSYQTYGVDDTADSDSYGTSGEDGLLDGADADSSFGTDDSYGMDETGDSSDSSSTYGYETAPYSSTQPSDGYAGGEDSYNPYDTYDAYDEYEDYVYYNPDTGYWIRQDQNGLYDASGYIDLDEAERRAAADLYSSQNSAS